MTREDLADSFPVDIIIHNATSLDPMIARHLITALGKRRDVTHGETYFIHVSQEY